MMKKESITKMYNEALDLREKRKGQVTIDVLDVEIEYTIKILGKVLKVKE